MAVVWIAAVTTAIHLYAGHNYGYFVDELYYLACGRHLAWGYVDQPPLIALIALVRARPVGRFAAGHPLPARRWPAAPWCCSRAHGARTWAAAASPREWRRSARCSRPASWASISFFSMNAFEPLFWMGCAILVIRIIRTGNQRLWLWFGLLAGLGLENKHSMLIFGCGIVLGLLAHARAPPVPLPGSGWRRCWRS